LPAPAHRLWVGCSHKANLRGLLRAHEAPAVFVASNISHMPAPRHRLCAASAPQATWDYRNATAARFRVARHRLVGPSAPVCAASERFSVDHEQTERRPTGAFHSPCGRRGPLTGYRAHLQHSPPAKTLSTRLGDPQIARRSTEGSRVLRGRVPRRGVGVGRPGSPWRVGPLGFMRPRRAA
jgi:hypothetical protein